MRYMWRAGPARFVIAICLRFVAVAAIVATPAFIGAAIDAVSSSPSRENLNSSVLGALIAASISIVTTMLAERQFAWLATRALRGLQRDLFDNMQDLSLSFFDRQSIGELMSRVTNDTEAVAQFYETVVSPLIRAAMMLVLVLAAMFVVNWQMTLAALIVIPVMLGLTGLVARVAAPAFARMQERLGEVSGFQEETISAQKVVVSNRKQDWAGARNEELADGVYEDGSRAFFAALLQIPITTFVVQLQFVVVVIVGALLVVSGMIEPGVVVAFIGFVGLLAAPLSEVANMTGTIFAAAAGARHVFEIIDERPTVHDARDAREYEFKGGHVVFDHVDFSYVPGREILHDNTFEVEPGQMIGIVGPTGAGKSTIINIITRYYDVASGEVRIDGQRIADLTQRSLRAQIGLVLQETFLFTDTVMNNLIYAREGVTADECIEAAKQANAHDFIMDLANGYDTMLVERGANLSQGQRQMITIARAIVAQPKILILDEATSNVDTRTEALVQQGLQRLMEGRTSFVIAHRLATVRDAAKILVLRDGEIIEFASHDDLMAAKGFYYDLYMGQFRGKQPAATG